MYVKSVEAQTSFHWCGMEVWRGGAGSGAILVTRPGFRMTSVVPARISEQSSLHCWRSPLPHASALRYSRPSSFHTLPKVIWCGSWGCSLGQSLSNHGPHVFYRRKIRRASRPGKQFKLVINEKPLDNACHVWSRIILLKYGCGKALKVRKDNWLQHFRDVALAV
ncbi:uncharacterized protein TNCV_3749731 [Trichonephila clavipes]|nr:uncharacterized protein TNCV_3749731 [Trichonephila clavipes]